MFARRTRWNLAPNALTMAVEAERARGRQLLDLTLSNPTCAGFDYPAEILDALADPRALRYDPAPKGLLPARQAVARYYAEQSQAELDPENLLLTVSTSEAYTFCFRLLCDPGDEVLVPVPSYPLFEFLAGLQDVRLVPYELVYDHGWQIEFESLRRALSERSRAILLVSPNNPTGSYVKPWELARLNELCRERSLALIADEVFLDYRVEASTADARSLAGNRGALTFALSGLSKISALPQMKLAWLVCSGPQELASDAMARMEVIADTYLSPNAPIQLAAPEMLAARHGLQRQIGTRVRANLAELDRQLAEQRACERLLVEGGWYAVLRVPAVRSDDELVLRLVREAGVLAHPGHFYGFAGEGHLVLSLIVPESAFAEGLRHVLRLAGE